MTSTADPSTVRTINRARVLQVIKQGPSSRADIARATGLSQPSVGAIVSDLISRRLVSEGSRSVSTGGRPPTLVQLNAGAYAVAGIKLMEDHLVGAITDLEATVLADSEAPLSGRSPDEVTAAMSGLVGDLLEIAGYTRDRLLGVGIGMAGVVDGRAGVCRYSPFFGWHDVPVAALAEEAMSIPVLVDNDVNTLALVERWFGVGHDADDFILVTLGRGVGMAAVTGGRLFRGHRGGAGELGHVIVDPEGNDCTCGHHGCLETIVAEPYLLEKARAILDDPHLTREQLYERSSQDPRLGENLAAAGTALGRALGTVVNLFAPELVIISGEGIAAGSALLDPVATGLAATVFDGLLGTYRIAVEPFDDTAWARGAASLVLSAVFGEPEGDRSERIWGRHALT